MKKFVFLFCLIFFLIFSLAFKNSEVNSFPLFGKLIILDPGHGNVDPGTIYENIYEKDYNLIFSNSLKQYLEKMGATVIMTRGGDYDLSNPNASKRKKSDFDNRIKLINDSSADVYISLHMNYLNAAKYYGSQVFYNNINKNNQILANIMQDNFNDFFEFKKTTRVIGDDKYMYKNISIPGVLIEYGFLSNEKDRYNLNQEEYRINLSKVIVFSLVKYFN